MRLISVFILMMFGWMSVQPQTGGLITAKTESAVLLNNSGSVSFGKDEKEFEKSSRRLSKYSNFIAIKRKLKKLTANALFGFNLIIGQKNICWILDGNDADGYVLYADFNADGDLSNDKPLTFKKTGDKYSSGLRRTLNEIVGGRKQKYSYDLKLEIVKEASPGLTERQVALRINGDAKRLGRVNVNNRQGAFAIFGVNGIYNHESGNLSFDLNGNGKLDGAGFSPESFKVKEKYVNIGKASYEFTVDRYGNSLILKPLAKKLPDRADLRVGNLAPDFSFKDLGGNPRRLSDFRGKVVLLDVWGL